MQENKYNHTYGTTVLEVSTGVTCNINMSWYKVINKFMQSVSPGSNRYKYLFAQPIIEVSALEAVAADEITEDVRESQKEIEEAPVTTEQPKQEVPKEGGSSLADQLAAAVSKRKERSKSPVETERPSEHDEEGKSDDSLRLESMSKEDGLQGMNIT